MVAVAHLKSGYPDDPACEKRARRALKYLKKKLGAHCRPWLEDEAVHDALEDEFDFEKAGITLTPLSKGLIVALGAVAGLTVLKLLSDKYRNESDEGDAEGSGDADALVDGLLEEGASVAVAIADAKVPTLYEPAKDSVERGSATQLGKMIGMTGREFNQALYEHGYLDGEPGNWHVTEKGAPYVIRRSEDNGYGGYVFRAWEWLMWDKSIVYEIGDPDAHLAKVNRKRESIDLPPLDSL